ncbi:MAG: hypothetical protein AB8G86_26090 [Saprospiraceae bacterium]
MHILIKNVAKVPNKHIKLLKWKIYNLAEKFKNLIYVEAFITSEGRHPVEYILKLRLGIPGHDIVITRKSSQIEKCIRQIEDNAHIRLVNSKEKVLW